MHQRLDRQSIAAHAAQYACFCAGAFVLLPKGFMAFGVFLIAATLMVPGMLASAWTEARHTLRSTVLMVTLLLVLTIASMQFSGQGWEQIDNMVRFILIPWSALFIYALAPSRAWLWWGAIVGVCIAFVIANGQFMAGIDRVGAGSNPIVFANVVLALLVLVIYCRPSSNRPGVLLLIAAVLVLGVIAIVLSGSRGALPGFVLALLVALVGSNGKNVWLRLGVSLALLAGLFALMWTIPWLASQTRLENIHSDLVRYAAGDVDTPIGARIEFLSLAWHAFLEHPISGIGLDRFGLLVRDLPQCQLHQLGLCQLGHAHNDLAQWAATMGIPGLLMIIALYLLPFLQFARIIRNNHLRAPVGAAWAGLLLVLVYFLSGLTQSMFAHALTTMVYAIFVGILLGLAMRESTAAATGSSTLA